MMRLFILNTTICIPAEYPAVVTLKKITVQEAQELVDTFALADQKIMSVVSVIGHKSTAAVLSQILEREIPVNRIQISCFKHDIALCFKLRIRLEEGKVLSEEELKNLEYDLIKMSY